MPPIPSHFCLRTEKTLLNGMWSCKCQKLVVKYREGSQGEDEYVDEDESK